MPVDWERFLGVLDEVAGELARAQGVQLYVVGDGLLHWDRKCEQFADEASAADDERMAAVVVVVVGVEKTVKSLDDVAYG